MSIQYVARSDCSIERGPDGCEKFVSVVDCDGGIIFIAPAAMDDENIWFAFDILNKGYDLGFTHGEENKATQIKRALGL